MMKFKKVSNVFLFSKFVREDGKFSIRTIDRYVDRKTKPKKGQSKQSLITAYVVFDELENEIESFKTMKKAKEKYSNL